MNYSNYFTKRGVDLPDLNSIYIPHYLKENIMKDDAILDFGCGYGVVLNSLIQSGYNAVGADICGEALDFCQKKGLKVVDASDLKNFIDEVKGKFDVVYLSHVLEHIPKNKIIDFLSELRKVLKKNGKLILCVPNAQSHTGCYWAYEDFTHYTLFTAGSLRYVLFESGFSSVQFFDPYDLNLCKNFLSKGFRKIALKLYHINRAFWNRVTASSYHKPSPTFYSYELRALVCNDD